MARSDLPDDITNTLIQQYVKVLSVLTGWGTTVTTDPLSGNKAVYPRLGSPFPREPYPAGYVYLKGIQSDNSQGAGTRRDICNVWIRIIGGPATPDFDVEPESNVYTMITGVLNELTYRPYLQDPTNNNTPFRYIDPDGHMKPGNPGQITAFDYKEQGGFIGIEIPTTVPLIYNVGRLA